MTVKKERGLQTVIYVPPALLKAVTELAREAGVSRSQWIVEAMEREASRSPQPARPGREEA